MRWLKQWLHSRRPDTAAAIREFREQAELARFEAHRLRTLQGGHGNWAETGIWPDEPRRRPRRNGDPR